MPVAFLGHNHSMNTNYSRILPVFHSMLIPVSVLLWPTSKYGSLPRPFGSAAQSLVIAICSVTQYSLLPPLSSWSISTLKPHLKCTQRCSNHSRVLGMKHQTVLNRTTLYELTHASRKPRAVQPAARAIVLNMKLSLSPKSGKEEGNTIVDEAGDSSEDVLRRWIKVYFPVPVASGCS